MRYFIKLTYKGANYHGWQIQPNATSVQGELQKALSLLLKDNIQITGAGRTDAGVHAINYYAHFNYRKKIIDSKQLVYKLNSFLNNDLGIQKIFEVSEDIHARFSAISRTYEYRIHHHKDPFLTDTSLRIKQEIDLHLMNQSAKYLFEYEDFTSFSKLHADTKTNNCKVYKAEWIMRNNQKVFIVKADRFLRNMVRAIVGTLLEVGKKKINPGEIKKIIESKNRSAAGASVPAHALFLTEIEYPSGIVDSY